MADTPQVTFEKMKSMHALIVRHRAGIKKAYEAARKDLRAGIDHEERGGDQAGLAGTRCRCRGPPAPRTREPPRPTPSSVR